MPAFRGCGGGGLCFGFFVAHLHAEQVRLHDLVTRY
jgi:hypothetical protein